MMKRFLIILLFFVVLLMATDVVYPRMIGPVDVPGYPSPDMATISPYPAPPTATATLVPTAQIIATTKPGRPQPTKTPPPAPTVDRTRFPEEL